MGAILLDAIKISEAELEILKVLWDSGYSMPAIEIFEELNKKVGWEDSTVRTLIRRLTQKGVLLQEKKEIKQAGRKEIYFYCPIISEKDYMKSITRKFVDKAYGGSTKALIVNLLKDESLSKKDIDELKAFWENERGQIND